MLWVRVGSMDEVDGTSGVAHVLEHMMFKGTPTRARRASFRAAWRRWAGSENAFTSRDYTGYYQQIPASRLEDVMRLEADRFAHNQWPDDEFKQRDRGGQGRAPHAHRRSARAPCCMKQPDAVTFHGLALPPPGGRLDERPGRHDAGRRARASTGAGTCRPTPRWWWPAMWTWRRCARWPKNTTAALPARAGARAQAAQRARAGGHAPHRRSRRRPSRPMWRWPSRCPGRGGRSGAAPGTRPTQPPAATPWR